MRTSIKKEARPRGRPRQFDSEAVLDRATDVFWARGFAAPSLDELAAAMGMNRPSITNAFGDKEAVYRRTLARFAATMQARMADVLFAEADFGRALTAFYEGALEVYCHPRGSRGCFVMCTAPVEAVEHPEVRRELQQLVREIDAVLTERFVQGQRDGQLPRDRDPQASAQMAQAVLHTLAIRARAGASKASLRALAGHAVRTLTR